MAIQAKRNATGQRSLPLDGASLPAELQRRVPEAFRRGWTGLTRRSLRVALLLASDGFASVAAIVGAVLLAQWLGQAPLLAAADLFAIAIFSAILVAVVLAAVGAYTELGNRRSVARMLAAVGFAALLGALHARLLPDASLMADLGSAVSTGFIVFGVALLYSGRTLIEWGLQYAYGHGYGQRRVLVVGSARETARVMRLIRLQGGADVRMVGRLRLPGKAPRAIDIVLQDLEPALRSNGASEVIFAASEASFEYFELLVQRCFEIGVPVSIAPQILHRIPVRLELSRTRVGAVLRLHPIGLGLSKPAVKRTMDVVFSILCLVTLFPIFLLIALAIKLDSSGPVIFRQVRTGLGGRPFSMYKFRTMVANADQIKSLYSHLNESGDPRLFKIRDDPRITRVGRILRRTSLDELPQLINVLAGEMSLIGPRPFFPEDLEHYRDHHCERLSVLPGITGLWQVRGRSAVLDFEEVVRLDREYIRGWSLWLDMKILLLTVPAVIRREGAY
jgi:exopolysaccharide biosynthesis polyprenyl glycosylphosphotransferase